MEIKLGVHFKGSVWPSKIFIHVLVSWVILGSTPPPSSRGKCGDYKKGFATKNVIIHPGGDNCILGGRGVHPGCFKHFARKLFTPKLGEDLVWAF